MTTNGPYRTPAEQSSQDVAALIRGRIEKITKQIGTCENMLTSYESEMAVDEAIFGREAALKKHSNVASMRNVIQDYKAERETYQNRLVELGHA